MLIEFEPPSERRYEDNYGLYLRFFHDIAVREEDIVVKGAPWSWVPLLQYLNCRVIQPTYMFEHCTLIRRTMRLDMMHTTGIVEIRPLDRTALEVLCCFRPETADALWKIDMQWVVQPSRIRQYVPQTEFIVTNNGSYHRPEVLAYLRRLATYTPMKRKTLLVPCAADKPYPAPLHSACLSIMPDDFYLMNATGVLGLVPQDLWPIMPHYDSGIPNQWRLYEIARDYFRKHEHDEIIVYCDFYAHVLDEALRAAGDYANITFVLPPIKYDDYVDLLSTENLDRLCAAVGR